MGQMSNDVAKSDAQIMLSEEECAFDMGQMSNDAAKRDAQIMFRKEYLVCIRHGAKVTNPSFVRGIDVRDRAGILHLVVLLSSSDSMVPCLERDCKGTIIKIPLTKTKLASAAALHNRLTYVHTSNIFFYLHHLMYVRKYLFPVYIISNCRQAPSGTQANCSGPQAQATSHIIIGPHPHQLITLATSGRSSRTLSK